MDIVVREVLNFNATAVRQDVQAPEVIRARETPPAVDPPLNRVAIRAPPATMGLTWTPSARVFRLQWPDVSGDPCHWRNSEPSRRKACLHLPPHAIKAQIPARDAAIHGCPRKTDGG